MNEAHAGLYLHIPFCKQACTYCDFHFSTSLQNKAQLVDAMCREIEMRREFLTAASCLRTLYFGGGTPSLLSAGELDRLLSTVARHFSIDADAEITLETNPDDLSPEKLNQLVAVSINRLSIGVQSFLEADLQAMNRSHNAAQARACIEGARAAGIDNFSVDLIFGLPDQGRAGWGANLDRVLALHVPHLSCYALTLENKTALAHQVRSGKVRLQEDETYEKQFLLAHERLEAAGYAHYELSNYCLPGYASRHNTAYWDQIPYLGIGPSAHSFDGTRRAWNVANNARYVQALEAGKPALAEEESLTPRDRFNEYLMTGLRRKSGIDAAHIRREWHIDFAADHAQALTQLIKEGLLTRLGDRYQLTPRGWLVSDRIIRDFFRL